MPIPIREWMDEQEMTIEVLAEETGLSRRTIVNARRGQWLNSKTVATLAAYTGLPIASLVPTGEPENAA